MTKSSNGPPIILPVLLAVVGIGALATAIVLVPSMVRRFAEATAVDAIDEPVVPMTVRESPAVQESPAVREAPVVEEPPAAPAVEEPPAVQEPPAVEEPEVTAMSDQREWEIAIDPDSYEIAPGGDAAVDAIIAVLAADGSTRLVLTGINHPSRSSKRALKAAKLVKSRVVADVGVARTRVSTRSEQDPNLEGVIVKALITGGDR